MRKGLSILFYLIVAVICHAQNSSALLPPPKVDERVELASIVFRFADVELYNNSYYLDYVRAIEKHFNPFKNHKAIQYAKQLRQKRGVAYDAVMAMAVHTTPPPTFRPLVPFSSEVPDSRWGKRRAKKFTKLLRQFYKDSNAAAFFKANQNRYRIASKRFYPVFEKLDTDWYQKFYGVAPKGQFIILNGLGNGGANYATDLKHPNGQETIFAVMGTWTVDSMGVPIYPVENYFPIVLHEFNHSFVNHLIDQYQSRLRPSCTRIFQKVRGVMESQAYGSWTSTIQESIVRAAVIKYMIDHQEAAATIQRELDTQIDSGFYWTKEVVEGLERYDANRDIYPTLESYMPELAKVFDKIANNLQQENK